MSAAGDFGGIIGSLIVIALVVTAVIIAVMALMSIGSLFGAGIALQNYYLAFRHNVQPVRVTP